MIYACSKKCLHSIWLYTCSIWLFHLSFIVSILSEITCIHPWYLDGRMSPYSSKHYFKYCIRSKWLLGIVSSVVTIISIIVKIMISIFQFSYKVNFFFSLDTSLSIALSLGSAWTKLSCSEQILFSLLIENKSSYLEKSIAFISIKNKSLFWAFFSWIYTVCLCIQSLKYFAQFFMEHTISVNSFISALFPKFT